MQPSFHIRILEVIDTDPSSNMTGQFGDVTLVEKFELSPEEYEKRTGPCCSFLFSVHIADWANDYAPDVRYCEGVQTTT